MQYSQDREEAIKKVPKNMDQIIAELRKHIDEHKKTHHTLNTSLQSKMSVTDFQSHLQLKLDLAAFEKWFPTKEYEDPKDFFKGLITKEIDLLQKNILDMVKLWDQKLVKMRSELNITSVVKRI